MSDPYRLDEAHLRRLLNALITYYDEFVAGELNAEDLDLSGEDVEIVRGAAGAPCAMYASVAAQRLVYRVLARWRGPLTVDDDYGLKINPVYNAKTGEPDGVILQALVPPFPGDRLRDTLVGVATFVDDELCPQADGHRWRFNDMPPVDQLVDFAQLVTKELNRLARRVRPEGEQ